MCALLGSYTASNCNPLPMFRDNVSVPSSCSLKMGLIHHPEMSVKDYHLMLHNSPEEHISPLCIRVLYVPLILTHHFIWCLYMASFLSLSLSHTHTHTLNHLCVSQQSSILFFKGKGKGVPVYTITTSGVVVQFCLFPTSLDVGKW
jgi:hypothetical protein